MKKKEQLNLRTDLIDLDIDYNSLRKWNCQNFTEIINKPKKSKYRRDSSRGAFSCEVSLDKFSNYDFQLSESSRYNQTMGNIPNLLDQNYTNYIHSIKKMYPNFRFNHYSNYSERARFNFSMMSSNSELKTYNTFDSHISFGNDDYIPSTKLANIGLGKEYMGSKEEFKLNEGILEESRMQLNNRAREYDYKVEAIEMELERVLLKSNLLFNYIERNMSLGTEIDYSINSLKSKKGGKEKLNSKYIINSSQIVLKGIKRQNIKKSMHLVSNLLKLYHVMNNISSLNKEEIECNEISEAVSESKALIKKIDQMKRLKCVLQCQKEIAVLENKSEHRLSGNLSNILKTLLMYSIQCDTNSTNARSMMTAGGGNKKKAEFIYKEDFQSDYRDYSYADGSKKIILISKDQGSKVYLYQLLDCTNIIIKDNFDIEDFIALIEKVFRDIIMKLFDLIQKEFSSSENIKIIEVLTQAFELFYLNYEYIIYLFELNFGWIKKIFNSLEKKIVEEMTQLISFITSSIVHEEGVSGELELYLSSRRKLSAICDEYYQLVKVEYSLTFKQFDLEFVIIYFERQRSHLLNCFDEETWTQLNEVDGKYIEMTSIISSQSAQLTLDSFSLINNNTSHNSNNGIQAKHEYILFKDIKYRAIALSLEEISFVYSCFYLSYSLNKPMIPEIAKNTFNVLKVICNRAKSLLSDENEEKQITDKEIALLSSNIQITKQIACLFAIATDTQKTSGYVNLINALDDINTECNNGMIQLLNGLSRGMIEDLTGLDFADYPFFEKDYNSYIKKFTKVKKLYDGMLCGFDNKDIIDIFNNQLLNSLNDMEKVINSKCRIELDNSLKQFRREMTYMKKVVKMFDLIKTESLIDKIESFSKKVNPTKVFKKKKKKEV